MRPIFVVWAIRESGNHALAGIWREGTDLKQSKTTSNLLTTVLVFLLTLLGMPQTLAVESRETLQCDHRDDLD